MNTAPIVLVPQTSITADVVGGPQTMLNYNGFAVQAIWTGASLMGSVKLQASLDYSPGGNAVGGGGLPPNSGTWVDLPSSSQSINGPGNFLYNVWPVMYPWFRVYFTYGSGTGTVKALGVIK